MKQKLAIIVPMANEEPDFDPFIEALISTLDDLDDGRVYLVVDHVSTDNTRSLCEALAARDERFVLVWAPENRNVVDAYIRGFREALVHGHEIIIEMDAGLSHDPAALPMFVRALQQGNDCVFGSRFMQGGSIYDSAWQRTFLSRLGTLLSNVLLGTSLTDATSGYQGFSAAVARRLTEYPLQSRAHFYQTEVRYLLRNSRFLEVPIHYRAPSPSVSGQSLHNSLAVLCYYLWQRILGQAPEIVLDKSVVQTQNHNGTD